MIDPMNDPHTSAVFRDTLRVGADALGLEVSPAQAEAFERLTVWLLDWNQRMNLTAVRDPRDVAVKHILDSMMCLAVHPFPEDARVLDVGTGAGFPGLVLKIMRPDVRLSLLDSTSKKLAFVEFVIDRLGWSDARAVGGRAEEIAHDPAHREGYDVVTARAVAAMRILSEFCLPFTRIGGVFLAMKGPKVREEMRPALGAVEVLGGQEAPSTLFTLPFGGGDRAVIPILKVARTPPEYPRIYRDIKRQPL